MSKCDAEGKVRSEAKDAGSLEAGWVLRYNAPREQTGSGTAIVIGCVLWNSFEAGNPTGMCSASAGHSARIYQAGFVSGGASCAAGFSTMTGGTATWKRFEKRGVAAAPANPMPQRSFDSVSILLNEPGQGPLRLSVADDNEALQSLYPLELDRSGHDCRHEGQHCE